MFIGVELPWFCQLDEACELCFPYLQDDNDNAYLCRAGARIKCIHPFD